MVPIRARRRARRLQTLLVVPALVLGLVASVQFAVAPHAAKAHADVTTGTAGLFTPLNARVMDTRNGTGGYSTPMAALTWRSLQIDGVSGIPTSGVTAVAITMTVIAATATGQARAMPTGSSVQPVVALIYGDGTDGDTSGSAISAVGADGKIQVETDTALDLVIDVQGYFSAGNGVTAPGGYVPINPVRVLSTATGIGVPIARLANASTTNLTVGGSNGIPSNASGVFVTLTPTSYGTSSPWLTVWPQGTTRPSTSVDFPGNTTYAIGASVDLNTSGQMSIYVGNATAPIDLRIDVVGYYTATAANGQGAFTPAATRVYDSRVSPNIAIPANATRTVRIGGIAGVPLAGAGVSATAMSLLALHSGTDTGSLRVWGDDQAEPTSTSMLTYASGTGSIRSDFQITQLGADGGILVHNIGADPINLVVDVQGWFSNVGLPVANGQTRTQQYLALQASPAGPGGFVTYKYRTDATAAFVNVPPAAAGAASWPVAKSSGAFPVNNWNMFTTLGAVPDTLVQVQACYGATSTDPNPVCSVPMNVTYARTSFGDSYATTSVGPGTLADLTGDYSVSATDVSMPSYLGSLTIGRTFTTLAPAADLSSALGVFGPGWTSDLPGPAAGDGDLAVGDHLAQGYVTFTGSDGSAAIYQATSPVTSYPVSFAGVGDAAADGATVSLPIAGTLTMTDSDGTITTWTKPAAVWAVSSVAEPGSADTTSYSPDSSGRVGRITGPSPAGITGCATAPDTTAGCRSLILTYTTVAGKSRLQKVSYSAWNPAKTGGAGMDLVDVAQYDYTSGAMLLDEYDPRITPNLKTSYTYDANSRLAAITPPGLAACTLAYDSTGRLSTVSRYDTVLAQTAVDTIAYGVPVSGSGAPVDLSATAAGSWGQTSDLPVTGTAVFGPNHQPATTPTSTDWPYASISYLDVNGRETNTATYGASAWQYGATAYDINGNEVWTLTPGNRAQALTPTADTDATAAAASTTAARAALLMSITNYDALYPDQVTDTYGPIHPVLNAGSTIHARTHDSTVYDEGAPVDGSGNPIHFGLPTTSTTAAWTSAAGDLATDSVTTRTGYSAVASGATKTGWQLDQATSTTTVGAATGGGDLTSNTRYNDAGQVVQSWLPGSTGSDARSTSTTYYTATGTGSCVSAWMAGLVCSTGPTAQPGSGNPLPVTTATYNLYSEPLVGTETAGATVRTTTATYDTAGRPLTSAIAVTPTAAGGLTVPTTTNGYSSTTGLPTTITAGSQTLTTGYDTLGRVNSYTDAAGTNSITGYDISGHAVSLNDGKGTTTRTYDTATTEHRGLVTSEDVGVGASPGTLTGSYDADGNLAVQTYPNGVAATTHYNNTGAATSLGYKQGATSWMSFTQTPDAQGRTATQSSPVSSQGFTYDTAGRLTKTQDTVTTPPPPALAIDTQTSADSTSSGGVITTPTFTTTTADTLIALVSTDGPTTAQTATVSGAGLTWTLVTRANTSAGDAEIWKATSTGVLTAVTVSATQAASGFHQSLSVVAMKGSAGVGASAHASAATGAPTVSLTTTGPGSLVLAAGNDWDGSTARTLGSGQTMVHEFSDSGVGDDFWAQRATTVTPTAGTVVTMNDTAPTTDRWNLAAVEVTAATGTPTTLCTTRQYVLDNDSNRTGYASTPGTGTTCTNGTPTTTGTFDGADRLTNTGYTYDTLGRTTTVPATDALGIGGHASVTGALTVGYYANDMVASQSQGSSGLTYALDPNQNRIYSTTPTSGTATVNHYSDPSDSPGWTSTAATWTRYLYSIDGASAGTIDQSGTTSLNLVNLHGDVVQTMVDSASVSGPSGTFNESTEFGTPRNAANTPDSYAWLGSDQRSANALGGVYLMGIRLYLPAMGRFLSTDPVYGGNDNPYVYVTNPNDYVDISGTVSQQRFPDFVTSFGDIQLEVTCDTSSTRGCSVRFTWHVNGAVTNISFQYQLNINGHVMTGWQNYGHAENAGYSWHTEWGRGTSKHHRGYYKAPRSFGRTHESYLQSGAGQVEISLRGQGTRAGRSIGIAGHASWRI